MTCKDCVHYEVCEEIESLPQRKDFVWYRAESGCPHFKNKADFVEFKQGKWCNVYMSSPSSFVGTCSECKRSSDIPPPEQARYCPRCGADMKKEGADNG